MSIRTVDHYINPNVPGRQKLKTSPKGQQQFRFDTQLIGVSAIKELLQTSPTSNPFFGFFEELLAPNTTDLIWREGGPGRGTEMRRTFSALFGRFLARNYLEQHHQFVWFAPLDGARTEVSSRLRVLRGTHRGDMPDWIMARPGELALGEAKGSRVTGPIGRGALPKPLQLARTQIERAVVEERSRLPDGSLGPWMARRVKGWGVMSRWATEEDGQRPIIYALDPETMGGAMSDPDDRVADVARYHLATLLEGLGRPDIATTVFQIAIPNDEVPRADNDRTFRPRGGTARIAIQSARVSRTARVLAPQLENAEFVGAVIGTGGVVPAPFEQLRAALTSLPSALSEQLFFVGIDTRTIDDALQVGRNIQERHEAQHYLSAEPAYQSRDVVFQPDGFVIARLDKTEVL